MSLIGSVLGKYRIVERLGGSARTEIYKGIQVGLDREVAVKVLPPDPSRDPGVIKAFRRESQSTARLSHPNIITIYDSGEQNGVHFYVMEFLKSESLADLIARGALPMPRVMRIAQDVLKALVYCHEKQVVHGALTAERVRFDLRENAILTGFDETGTAPREPAADLHQTALLVSEMLGAETPDSLAVWLGRALDSEPAARFASAKDMLLELKRIELKQKARKASSQTQAVPSMSGAPSGSQSATSAISTGPASAAPSRELSGSQVEGRSASLSGMFALPRDRAAQLRLAAIAIPTFLVGLLGVLWFLMPRPEPTVVEQARDVESTKATLRWKTSIPCFSEVEYWPAADTQARLRTARCTAATAEHSQTLAELHPGTTYGFRFLLSSDGGAPFTSPIFELTTAPDVQVFNIHADPYANRCVLTWETNVRTDTCVRLGDGDNDRRANVEQRSETIHTLALDELAADTDYHYRIVATPSSGRGAPTVSEDMPFHTPRAEDAGPEKDPLVNLTRSYVDKLGRMTPDEREKLKTSIEKFTDLKDPLTAEQRKMLTSTATKATDEDFATRLQLARRWLVDLALAGKVKDGWGRKAGILQALFYTNRRQAAHRLDEWFRAMALATS